MGVSADDELLDCHGAQTLVGIPGSTRSLNARREDECRRGQGSDECDPSQHVRSFSSWPPLTAFAEQGRGRRLRWT